MSAKNLIGVTPLNLRDAQAIVRILAARRMESVMKIRITKLTTTTAATGKHSHEVHDYPHFRLDMYVLDHLPILSGGLVTE